GSGLGLFVTYGLITQHGGEVKVTSSPGVGTTFTLRFPLVAAKPAEVAGTAVRPRAGARVLVVDDETVVRDVIGSILRNAGVTVTEAPDGRAALEALRAEAFDLMITDLSMPEMSGIELAREARASTPSLPILL